MDFNQSETKKNLEKAFSGESQARNKYTYFAKIAKKEGYEQIADIFLENAENEKEHAKIWFNYLFSKGTTKENLQNSIDGENYEYDVMYKEFEQKAREEGFDEIADKFKYASEVEKFHRDRFQKLLNNLINDEVFKKKTSITVWKCKNCGHIHVGLEAPYECPFCKHSQSFFEICNNNY